MIDKTKLKDTSGRPMTQSLFLEINYNEDYAVYTLKDEDYEYKGRVYPSLKKLFLEMEDPTEYSFSTRHLLGWQHWKRLNENKMLAKHFEEWREELELKLRSQAIRDMQNLCSSENGNFGAAKFLADRGWDKKAVGRPSKSDMERHMAVEKRLDDEFSADVARLEDYRR